MPLPDAETQRGPQRSALAPMPGSNHLELPGAHMPSRAWNFYALILGPPVWRHRQASTREQSPLYPQASSRDGMGRSRGSKHRFEAWIHGPDLPPASRMASGKHAGSLYLHGLRCATWGNGVEDYRSRTTSELCKMLSTHYPAAVTWVLTTQSPPTLSLPHPNVLLPWSGLSCQDPVVCLSRGPGAGSSPGPHAGPAPQLPPEGAL